jgi:hypothetical protein
MMCIEESFDEEANPDFKTAWWTPRLAGPVLAAAAVRLVLLAAELARFGTNALFRADTVSYLEPGRNLLLHGRFIADGVPDLVRTPGYPLFLALTSLAGFPAAAVANVLLSVFSVILVWKLSRTASGNESMAIVAAWLFAFEPLSVVYSVVLLSENLFLLFFLLSLERITEFLRRKDLRTLGVAGLWLAAATLVRPITYYLPVALALGLFAVLVRVPGLRWKAPAVLLISAMPWLAAWQMRNWITTGYGGMSSVSEINLYCDAAAGVTARLEHRPFLDVRKELGYFDFDNYSGQFYLFPPYLARNPEQAGWTQGKRLAFMHSEAVRVIRAHYGVYLQLCLSSMYTTVFGHDRGYFFTLANPETRKDDVTIKDDGLARGATAHIKPDYWHLADKNVFKLVSLTLYLFAVWGIFRGGIRNGYLYLLLGTLLYILIITAMGTGAMPGVRLRHPVMPLVCIFASAGLVRLKTITR